MIMERFHSDTLLPQDFPSPAKKSLVKLPRSESETNIYFNMDLLSMGDFAFKPKKRKSIYTSCYKSSPELNRKGETLMASSSEIPKRKLTRVASKDDLWKSIQSNYTFLMADDLITECQETQSELHLSPTLSTKPKEPQHKPHQIITHPEFLERFNRLHDTLHSLQTSAIPVNVNETQSNKLQVEYQFLKEQALLLKLMHPDLKDEVNRRCNILGSKMSILERVLFPRRAQERDRIIKSLTTQMKGIRKWLQDVEAKLRKLKISEDSAIEDISDVLKQEKSLQREIEGQGKELTALVRQCQSLEGATPAEAKRLRRAAAHLERSWHNIWLRSLEKQCLTEQRLIQSEENSRQETSDIELDEGPLNKHRRLTLDKWKAVATAATMDKVWRDRPKDHLVKTGLLTKDVGVHCCEKVSVNDKAIMVGTTAIDALKLFEESLKSTEKDDCICNDEIIHLNVAEYGDDFTNFEIIQDVGYSSESSTHLSSDDGICIGDHHPYFNHHHHRIYHHQDNKPQPPPTTTNLKDELALATTINDNKPDSLGSSLGSSSGGLNDSGLGTTSGSGGGRMDELVEAYVPGEESDFLEKVLDSCVDFGAASDGGGKEVELQYCLSGVEESDVEDFHNRSSFTTSSQLFYKMISVDSENDSEIKADDSSKLIDSTQCHPDNSKPNLPNENNNVSSPPKEELEPQTPCADELETPTNPPIEKNSWCFDSSPELDGRSTRSFHTPSLKRKRDYDTPKSSPNWHLEEDATPIRGVRSWLTRCSSNSSARRRLFRQTEQLLSSCDETVPSYNHRTSVPVCEDVSSCDASGEYTSSSADESNPASSASSYFEEEDVLKERQDSFSAEGSVETVIRGLQTSFHSDVGGSVVEMSPMLPPPFSSTPSCIRKGRCKSGKSTLCNFSYPFGDPICGNMRWLAMKASSEGDLRNRSVHADGCQHQLSKLSKHKDLPKNFTTTSPYDSKHRLSSSLPNVLHQRSGGSSSDDAKSSARYLSSDKGLGRSNNGQDESLTSSVLSTTMSSSSDPEKRKKRRNRRKSSSSNRSSRSVLASGDSLRNRSRTLTSSSNRSSSRMRHISQNSEFFEDSVINLLSDSERILSQINIETVEELNQTNLKDELELALKESRSSVVLSPTESDVVLTQFEEQSIASDQVWDGYQDMPYLSEAYSEATVDEDAIRKLTEFGDDYGSAIGQPLRYLDSSSSTIGKTDAPKSPSRKSSKIPAQAPISDSDSDLEDLHHVVEEAGKALLIARASLKRRKSGDFFSSAENAELLATCGTHLDCLITLREFIEIDGKENIFSTSDIKELHYLISEWKRLKRSVEMYEEADDAAQHKYLEAQKSIDLMFNKLSKLLSLTDMDTSAQMSWDELKDNILKLQLTLTALQETKDQLISVNIQVHRFMTEYGSDVNYKDCCLKENVTELYQKWDDIYEQNGARLTELQTVEKNWKTFDENLKTLIKKGKKHTRSTTQVCDKNCLQSKDVPDEILQKDLKLLQSDAESEDGASLKNLLELHDPKNKIQNQTHKNLASRIADPSLSSADEDDPDDHFEDALHHLDRPLKKDPPQTPSWRSSRIWRILRVAFPVQLTLVLLFCLACYLEPNCCDRLNNFTLSFTPHLRYPKGPPPV